MKFARHDDALLAGVCAGIADRFGWNVWALRAVFLAFLLVKTLWARGQVTPVAFPRDNWGRPLVPDVR